MSLALAGCAAPQQGAVTISPIVNSEGHVIGHTDGDKVVRYRPYNDEKGQLAGDEESVPGGTVLMDLHGRRIGVRMVDLRNKGNNQQTSVVTMTIKPASDAAAR